jgi:hypothetical protein
MSGTPRNSTDTDANASDFDVPSTSSSSSSSSSASANNAAPIRTSDPPAPEQKAVAIAPYELTNAEDIKIAEGLVGDAKVQFINVIRDIVELNGTGDIPGIQASYIDVKEYVQSFDSLPVSNAMKKALFMAYNWLALGKGAGGLAGSAVRWALKNYYTAGREMTVHIKVPAGAAAVLAEYDRAAMAAKDLVNFFMTNAVSVAALAGAMVNRIVHHWDSKHTGAQKAFISAMGMSEHLSDDQYRAVFYLAIHPLPLSVTEEFRRNSANGSNNNVAEVVRLRCVGPPAGYGAVNACAAAVSSLLSEKVLNTVSYVELALPPQPGEDGDDGSYMRAFQKVSRENEVIAARRAAIPDLRRRIEEVQHRNAQLIAHAGNYHQFSSKYGLGARQFLDTKELEPAMILLTAYIFAKVKGSLANSAAIKKFRDQHARPVQKAVAAFASLDEGETIFDVLGI